MCGESTGAEPEVGRILSVSPNYPLGPAAFSACRGCRINAAFRSFQLDCEDAPPEIGGNNSG
jgi:hypothetical protein